MSNIKEHLIMRATEAFEELNVSRDIIDDLEDYFEENINEEEYLNRLPKVIMDSMQSAVLKKTIHGFLSMEKYHYKDYLKKYFNALYRMGREGLSQVISFRYNYGEEKMSQLIDGGIDETEIIGIYLNKIIYDHWNFSYHKLEFLHTICKKKCNIAKKVRDNLYNSENEEYIYGNADRILESIYCYYNFESEKELCKKYIENIEESIVDIIKKIFKNSITEQQLNQIEQIIYSEEEYNEEENRELINCLKTYKSVNYLFKFIVAISCLNRKCSYKLDKLTRLFMDIDYKNTIKIIIDMTPHNEKDYKKLDKTLDIPTKYYIAFKADGSVFDEFMQFKCEENKEAFKEAIKLCNEEAQNKLMLYLLDSKEDKEPYIKELEDRCKKYINYLLNEYNAEVELILKVNEFLDKNIDFTEIKDKLEIIGKQDINIYKIRNKFDKAMKSLMKLKENKVYDKIIAILFKLNLGEFIGDISNISLAIEKDKNIEAFLKNYKLADEYSIEVKNQMITLDSLVTGYYYERTYKKPVETIIDVLLKNHKEEVIKNIKNVSPESRCLYLSHIYLEENENNAEVILNNFADNSKLVKEHIIEIFKDSIKYFDKVILKLNAKKQGEREVAIKVLEKWLKDKNYKLQ